MPDQDERHTFQVDVETENPLALVQSRLRDLDLNGGLTRVQVRLESSEPIQLKQQASDGASGGVVNQPPESDAASGGMGPATAEAEQDDEDAAEPQTITCADCGAELDATGKNEAQVLAGHRLHCSGGDADDGLTRFQEDSDTFAVARTLHERRDEGLLEMDEVRQFTSNSEGVPEERFSPILWDLAERGLVEKQPPKHDGQQHRYRLTDKGVASVEASLSG